MGAITGAKRAAELRIAVCASGDTAAASGGTSHRIFEAIMAGKPEEAREASRRHLAFIEVMLDRSREGEPS